MILDVGRIALKIAGREAGCYAVVVGKIDDNHVLITGPKTITHVKRRKCNIVHLEPTEHRFELTSTEDGNLEHEWKKSGLIEKLGIVLPKKRARESKPSERPVRKRKIKAEKK